MNNILTKVVQMGYSSVQCVGECIVSGPIKQIEVGLGYQVGWRWYDPFFFYPFFSPISWYPIVVVATILSHRYNSRTGSGETKVESHAFPDTQPNQPHCFLTQRASNPEASRTNVSEETLCTCQLWLACTAPDPPQESLVRDETRISLPAKPSLTQTTLGQLCIAPQTSRSRPVTTEREPRVSGGTAGAAVQRP